MAYARTNTGPAEGGPIFTGTAKSQGRAQRACKAGFARCSPLLFGGCCNRGGLPGRTVSRPTFFVCFSAQQKPAPRPWFLQVEKAAAGRPTPTRCLDLSRHRAGVGVSRPGAAREAPPWRGRTARTFFPFGRERQPGPALHWPQRGHCIDAARRNGRILRSTPQQGPPRSPATATRPDGQCGRGRVSG